MQQTPTETSAVPLPAPYEGDEPFIFVSYKREDLPRIAPFLEAVIRWGYRIWFDRGVS